MAPCAARSARHQVPEQAAWKKQRGGSAAAARLEEEKRRDRAPLTRYPVKSVHDQRRIPARSMCISASHRLVTLR